MQVKGIDFDKFFAPVAKLLSLCAILALATKFNLEVHQIDIKSAYLNGVLDRQSVILLNPHPVPKAR